MRRLPCILAVVVWSCCSAFAQNLLTNPSFEDVDAAGAAVGWTFNGGATLVADAQVAHTGTRVVKVRFDDRFQQVLAEAEAPAIEAPVDLRARRVEVVVPVMSRVPAGCRVVLDLKESVQEVTEANNATGAPRA